MVSRTTVIIAAYNAEATIRRALDSALAQTARPNVILVDDASTDRTLALAETASSDRLTIVRQSANRGPSEARNRALERVRTEWATPLDADDAMEPGRIAALEALGARTGADLIADDLWRVIEGGAASDRKRHWRDADIGEIELDLATFALQNIGAIAGAWRELAYVKPLMRMAFLQEHGLRYQPGMRLGEDYDLYARSIAAGARFLVTDPLGYIAFDRPGSLSKSHRAVDLWRVYAADRALLDSRGLSRDTRRALRKRMAASHKKWAWARLIEAVRTRRPLEAAACFFAPPATVGALAANVAAHITHRTRSHVGLADRGKK